MVILLTIHIEILRINAVMDRVKSMYQWPSLDAKICLNIMSIKAYDGSFTTTAVDLGKMDLKYGSEEKSS